MTLHWIGEVHKYIEAICLKAIKPKRQLVAGSCNRYSMYLLNYYKE